LTLAVFTSKIHLYHMEKHILKAVKRTLVGRKVSSLRKQGITPANIYGKNIKSAAVQVNVKDFIQVFKQAGETGLVELQLEDKKLPVLIHNIQVDPITEEPLHVDFYQVNLKEKVNAAVKLDIIGESVAVKDKIGVLLNLLSEIEVEALPGDLPENIKVDVSNLKTVDETIKVKDLKLSDKVKIITDGELDVVKVVPLVSKEAEKMAQEEAAAAVQAEEAKEGEKPAETREEDGQKKTEEKTTEAPADKQTSK